MKIALATALALCLATPAFMAPASANENLAFFRADAAAKAETEIRAASAEPTEAAPVESAPVETASTARADETTVVETQAAEAAPSAASHPAKSFFLMDAAARADEGETPETTQAAAPAQAAPAAPAGSVQALVTAAALRHGIDPVLAHAMARTESNYRCSAVGRAGELGVMQVKPATARSVGVTGNLRDCATGIEAGMRYLRAALDRHGTGCGGISAYNMGIHRASSFCNGYGRKVMARMARVEVASLR
ncbi:lytic transglycosylase domain-containing protein [Salinarimonas ramus]|uniref:Transglycosylase SLT domain-containing protein n=1 Tax=Salinarimonas ramus TaxID=690164 RepID=A0A917Q601_9HYPH|nr:lytic transglycosylase domain-containing protein [Salinarimonas ramus]GGK28151.1 hypothetical protein GCM10011322_13340 [Salinarimonas ramus]